MVALNFDISTIETSEFSPLNPGVYRGEIVSAEQKTSQNGNDYLALQITVGNNRRVFDNLNLWHTTSAKAVEIGKQRLAEIAKALGLGNITDSEVLIAKPMNVRIGIRKDDPSQNEVIAYEPPDSTMPPPAVSAAIPAPVEQQAATAGAPLPWRS
jgi:hypothetical protein